MMICENCGANVPKLYSVPGIGMVCCEHCAVNPLGCRCKFGEYGIGETEWYDLCDDFEPECCPYCGKEYEDFSDYGCEHCDVRVRL